MLHQAGGVWEKRSREEPKQEKKREESSVESWQEWEEKNINEKIEELRKHLNLSLAAFSKLLGCSPTQVKRMEIGTVVPTEDDIRKICEAFQVDEEYFKGTKTRDIKKGKAH